jgi:hypothetical protein
MVVCCRNGAVGGGWRRRPAMEIHCFRERKIMLRDRERELKMNAK